MKHPIRFIAFDADDTLWDCQGHFEQVMQHLYELLQPWADHATATRELYATERKNMPLLGYGVKAFTLSVIETALRVSRHELSAALMAELLQRCYGLLQLPATPLPGVTGALTQLQDEGWRMAVFTKGELQDQENKLRRSGLGDFFEHVEITSDKQPEHYLDLCRHLGTAPEALLMVGNSLRSDVTPALAVGAWAVHVPFHITWELEHAEAFEHERLLRIEHFGMLPAVLREHFVTC